MANDVTLDAQTAANTYVTDIKAIAQSMPAKIADDNECDSASRVLKAIMGFKKDVENKRLSFTRPLDGVKKALIDSFRKPISELEELEGKVKALIRTYLDEKAREQQAAEQEQKKKQALAEAEASAKADVLEEDAKETTDEDAARGLQEQADAVRDTPVAVVATPVVVTPSVDRRMFRTKYVAHVIDMALLPDEFKLPDMSALNKLAKQNEGKNPPPGVEFEEE